MVKVWLYKRKERKNWWVGWYSDGKRHSKCLPNKSLAQQFAERKCRQFNEDIYPDPISMLWDDIVGEYLNHKETVESRSKDTLRISRDTLKLFREINGPVVSTKFNQRHVDTFIACRLELLSKHTVNKEVRTLKTFVKWAIRYRYMGQVAARIIWTMQKVPKHHPKALNAAQRRNLCIAARKYKYSYYIRVLLALTTGLRKSDIENLQISDIDFESKTISTFSTKTGKSKPMRPLQDKVLAELTKYINILPEGQIRLFPDTHIHKQWKKIRKQAGLLTLKFHDLRKTFGSVIAQQGYSQSVVQNLLEHSSPQLTHEIYTDVEPCYRAAIESIPIDDIVELDKVIDF